jgi:hypothetical protein
MNPEIFILRPDDARSWALMPYALARIKAFCIADEPDEEPESLVFRVETSFVRFDGVYGIIVVLQDGQLVGHVLLRLEQIVDQPEKRWLTVEQYSLDKGSGVTLEIARESFGKIRTVARVLKATSLRARVKDEARERAFRAYGFKRMAILLHQEVGE